LVFFVRQGDRITHVVVREGRVHRHDLAHQFSDPEPHSAFVAEDFDHTPLVRVKLGLKDDSDESDILDEPLKWNTVSFEWRDDTGKRVFAEGPDAGATRFGSPSDVSRGLPDKATRESFYWLSSLAELGLGNRVRKAAYDNAPMKPGILAQVPLEGGSLRTSVFAWAEDDKSGSKVRLIPELQFAAALGMDGPMKRAAAEGITWTVAAPQAAEKLLVLKRPFGSTDEPQVIHAFDVAAGGKARVGVTNYPRKREDLDPKKAHPGRAANVGSLHFGMLYDLLQGPIPPGKRYIPWIPPKFDGNFVSYEKDLGSPFDTNLEGIRDSPAAVLFLKDDRPICVDGSGTA
jgi:hypothetical protein